MARGGEERRTAERLRKRQAYVHHRRFPAGNKHDNPTLNALYEEARRGCCAICDALLTGRKRKLCGSAECIRVYNNLVGFDRRGRERRQREVALAVGGHLRVGVGGISGCRGVPAEPEGTGAA